MLVKAVKTSHTTSAHTTKTVHNKTIHNKAEKLCNLVKAGLLISSVAFFLIGGIDSSLSSLTSETFFILGGIALLVFSSILMCNVINKSKDKSKIKSKTPLLNSENKLNPKHENKSKITLPQYKEMLVEYYSGFFIALGKCRDAWDITSFKEEWSTKQYNEIRRAADRVEPADQLKALQELVTVKISTDKVLVTREESIKMESEARHRHPGAAGHIIFEAS